MTVWLANRSRNRALAVLAHHLRGLERGCREALQAVVLTGSLVTGCYTGDAGSDIDLVHILKDDAPEEARAQVLACIERTEQEMEYELQQGGGALASAGGRAGACVPAAGGGLCQVALCAGKLHRSGRSAILRQWPCWREARRSLPVDGVPRRKV